jgi:hypothetical protein
VVGEQPIVAARDDGPECPEGRRTEEIAERPELNTKNAKSRIDALQNPVAQGKSPRRRGVVRLYGRSGQKAHRDGRWRRCLACRGFEDALAAGSQRGSRAQ